MDTIALFKLVTFIVVIICSYLIYFLFSFLGENIAYFFSGYFLHAGFNARESFLIEKNIKS